MTTVTPDQAKLLATLQGLTSILEKQISEPYGPPANPELRQLCGNACVQLCAGDQDKARTLWKLITAGLGDYMPHAAASALVRATNTNNLVPDIEPSMENW